MQASINSAEVKQSDIEGRGLFVTQNLKAGELIFKKNRPLIASLDWARQDDTCNNCFKSGLSEDLLEQETSDRLSFEVKKCTGCRQVSYCSKTCQSQHWKRSHKGLCKPLKKMMFMDEVAHRHELQSTYTAVIALAELVEMRRRSILSENEWLSVLQMKSHATEMETKSPARYGVAVSVAKRALLLLGHPNDFSANIITQLACAILANSLTLVAPTCDPLGLVFDPFACLANHSCEPNAFVVMNGAELSFRTLKEISCGQEVLVSYVDNTEIFRIRHGQLAERYLFECICTKCEHGPNPEQDRLLSSSSLEVPAGMEASSPEDAAQMRRRYGFEGRQKMTISDLIDCHVRDELLHLAELDIGPLNDVFKAPLRRIDRLKQLLSRCRETGLYKVTGQPYAFVRDEYILECITQGELEIAWRHALKSDLDIDPVLYPELHNPIRVVHTYRLAKLTMLLADEDEYKGQELRAECAQQKLDMPMLSWRCLKQAAQHVDRSHGHNSPFAHVVKAAFKAALDEVQRFGPDSVARMEHSLVVLESTLRAFADKLQD